MATPTLDDATVDHLFACASKDSYFFELIIRRVYEAILAPGDTAVDGGACGGIHTIPMAHRVGESGRVHAVEAHPGHAEGLRKKIDAQRLRQVTIHDVAISNERGVAEFVCVKTHPSRSGLRKLDLSFLPVPAETETVQVKRVLLDDIVSSDRGPWRFCKLDLEGGEYHALLGGQSAITQHRPFIVFENGREVAAKPYGYTCEDWFSLFERLGYEVFDLFGRPFTRASWRGGRRIPWYCMAVSRAGTDVKFVADTLPRVLRRVIDEVGEPAGRYATLNWWKLQPHPPLEPVSS
jgi:FkbM family methyltransferase